MGMRSLCGAVAAGFLLLASSAAAQPSASAVKEGWHVVRPGETLWAIAERYLGSEEDWVAIHQINPQIANPHRITPGQRIRVQVAAEHAVDVAQVVKVSRRVEEQLTPHPWSPSTEQDLLNPRDGVRTFESSSSELLFADDSRLVISEDSLVFLGFGGEVEREVRRDEIEIVVGQADFGADGRVRVTAVDRRRGSRQAELGRRRARPGADPQTR